MQETARKSLTTLRNAGIGVFLVGTASFANPHSLVGQGLDSVVGILKRDYGDCVTYIYDRMAEGGYTGDPGTKMQTSFLTRLACLDIL